MSAPDKLAAVERSRPRSLLSPVLTPVAASAAAAAGTASFVDGVAAGDHPSTLPWYALDWDILYYVERAFVLFSLLVIAAIVVTTPFVERRWRRAYTQIASREVQVEFLAATVSYLHAPDESDREARYWLAHARLNTSLSAEVVTRVNELLPGGLPPTDLDVRRLATLLETDPGRLP